MSLLAWCGDCVLDLRSHDCIVLHVCLNAMLCKHTDLLEMPLSFYFLCMRESRGKYIACLGMCARKKQWRARSNVWCPYREKMTLKGNMAANFSGDQTTTQPCHPDGVWNNGREGMDLYENDNNHGFLHLNRTVLYTILSHTFFHLKQWSWGLLTLSHIYSPSCQALAWAVTIGFQLVSLFLPLPH